MVWIWRWEQMPIWKKKKGELVRSPRAGIKAFERQKETRQSFPVVVGASGCAWGKVERERNKSGTCAAAALKSVREEKGGKKEDHLRQKDRRAKLKRGLSADSEESSWPFRRGRLPPLNSSKFQLLLGHNG